MTLKDRILNEIADVMLACAGVAEDAPHYRERTLAQKETRHLRACLEKAERFPLVSAKDMALLLHEWDGIVRFARLTRPQLEVLTMRLQGASFEEIGRRRGHTKQGAQRIFGQARDKLARAWRRYPYRGLAEVYNQEMGRLTPPSGQRWHSR